MQEEHSIQNSNKCRDGERHGTDDEVTSLRPSDKMVAALEAEGLNTARKDARLPTMGKMPSL